jgi:hypothetical protein
MIYLETLPVRETSVTGVRRPSVKGGFPWLLDVWAKLREPTVAATSQQS